MKKINLWSFIKNSRYGLATNSSSSHSIIYNPALLDVKDNHNSPDFGWDFFTIASAKAKGTYLDLCLYAKLGYEQQEILDYLVDTYAKDSELATVKDGYVDHESVIHFPSYDLKYPRINMSFYKEYRKYITENEFFILGGNDNTEDSHPLSGKNTCEKQSYSDIFWNKMAYWNGNYWVVMNHKAKHRVKFTDGDLVPKVPELVDLKITDFCDMGCSFCYQNSTTEGKHASFDNISKLSNMLPYNVEYALGGGEPTSHPEFDKILYNLQNRTPFINFTTKSDKWFHDENLLKAVNACVSGIAYSVTSYDVQMLEKFYNLHLTHVPGVQMYIHLIPDLLSINDLKSILDWAKDKSGWQSPLSVRVTLLGYKEIGRAVDSTVPIHSNIFDTLEKYTGTRLAIGVDTKFLNDYNDFLPAWLQTSNTYTTKEGEYSMYIDAVTSTAYRSSYDTEHSDYRIPLTFDKYRCLQKIEDVFGKIRGFSGFPIHKGN